MNMDPCGLLVLVALVGGLVSSGVGFLWCFYRILQAWVVES